jgi:ubiquinone/menaquinone biosynthesis C-methylase UbiE
LARISLASLLAALLALSAGAQTPKPRLFPPEFLGLLDAPDRDQWQKPEQILDALGIAEGMVVADLGAGSGWFSIRLAHRVGPNGLVFAEDIQREMIEAMSRRFERERLTNVQTVLGTDRDPRLPSPVDAVLIVSVFHEMEDPVALLKNVVGYLKPQGRVGVVDFLPGGGGPGPAPEDRVDPDVVIRTAAAAGLQLMNRETVPPFVYLLVFGRATARVSP